MDEALLAETDEYSLADELPPLTERADEGAAGRSAQDHPRGTALNGHQIVRGLLLLSRARRILFADGLTRVTTDKALRARACLEELVPENVPDALMADFLELIYVGHRLAGDQEDVLSNYAERLLLFAGRLEDIIDTKLESNDQVASMGEAALDT